MAENDQVTQQGNQDQGQGSLGWRSALPDEFKEHEFVKDCQKPGDFVKRAIDTKTERDSLKTKLEGAIPKLPDNATDEEKNIYQMEMGRPEKWEQYELPGQKDDAPEWTDYWKQEFFKQGVSKDLAKSLAISFNGQINKLVEANNASIKKQIGEASEKLKAELGDKYDSSVELARRFWENNSDSKFDEAFNAETSVNRVSIIRFLLKTASKTGEDNSPKATNTGKPGTGNTSDWFPNSPKMHARK